MARPKNQTARRRQISDAARRVLIDRGASGLQLKDIAEGAGLSSGSVLYYYPEMEQLLTEVYEDAVERFSSRRGELADSIAEPAHRLAETILAGLATGPEDAEVYLLHVAVGYFDRYPSVRLVDRMLFDRQVGMYQTILAAGAARGEFALTAASRDIATNMVALEDTYNFHIVTGHPGFNRQRCANLIGSYAEQATSCHLPELQAGE